jgi:hypothetical protein
MRFLLRLIGVMALGAAAGCGSSHPTGVSFHSATHHYTVSQVQQVFAAQGIRLRRATIPGHPGVAGLRRDHLIEALVVARSSGLQYFDAQHHRHQRDGNVVVLFTAPDAKLVETALARLH